MTDREKLIELMTDLYGGDPLHYGVKAYHIADHLIAHGVTFATDTNVGGKWISVEDDKPKRRGQYFVSYVFADYDMQFYGVAFWNDGPETNGYVTGPHFSTEDVHGMKVTHWMPMPELPKEREMNE